MKKISYRATIYDPDGSVGQEIRITLFEDNIFYVQVFNEHSPKGEILFRAKHHDAAFQRVLEYQFSALRQHLIKINKHK